MRVDLAALADELDAETLRNSAGRELFTNPAKALADRMSGRDVVLAGDNAGDVGARPARRRGAAAGRRNSPSAAVRARRRRSSALRGGMASGAADYETSLFHDEEIDGPLPARVRTVVLATDEERPADRGERSAGYDDVDVISAEDVPDVVDAACRAAAPSSSWRCWRCAWRWRRST